MSRVDDDEPTVEDAMDWETGTFGTKTPTDMMENGRRSRFYPVPVFSFTDDDDETTAKKNTGKPDEYPLSSDCNCAYCRHPFDTVPVFRVMGYDEKRNKYVLDPHPNCGLSCAKGGIISEGAANIYEQIALLHRFAREFFGYHGNIKVLPWETIRGNSPGATLGVEEWRALCATIGGVVKEPPWTFAHSFVELKKELHQNGLRGKELFSNIRFEPLPEANQLIHMQNLQRVRELYREKRKTQQSQAKIDFMAESNANKMGMKQIVF